MSYHSPDETTEYLISLAGRDDGVQFLMELTETEKTLIDRVIELANKASENEFIPAMCISDEPDDINEFLKSHND